MGTEFFPKVSIIIPAYNASNYLAESLDSALAQTYKNLEIIVVNDGSEDGGETERVALSYGDKIKYYHKPNGGVSSALNYGIKHMTGEYFSWLSHDDKYEPEKVGDAVNLLAEQDEISRKSVIAFTDGYYIDSHSRRMKDFPSHFEAYTLYDGKAVVEAMLRYNTLNGCCMLIPKDAFERCGGFDETLRYNQDALMWYILFTNGYKLISDNKKNVMYRLHRSQTSKLRRDLFIHDTIKSSDILIPLFAENSDKQNNLLYLYAKRVAINNCLPVVNKCIAYGKAHSALSENEVMKLRILSVYGCFRYVARNIRNSMLK